MNKKKLFAFKKKLGKNERNMKKNLNRFSDQARNEGKMRKKYLTTAGVGSMKIS